VGVRKAAAAIARNLLYIAVELFRGPQKMERGVAVKDGFLFKLRQRVVDEYILVIIFVAGWVAFFGSAVPSANMVSALDDPNLAFDPSVHWFYLSWAALNFIMLLVHLARWLGGWLLTVYFSIGLFIGMLFLGLMRPQNVSFLTLLALAFNFGTTCLVLLSEMIVPMRFGVLLTRWWKNWVKEIEYVYVIMGGTGILAGMNKMPNVVGQVKWLNAASPLILTFAIVIKLIKTRAEVAGWNTQEFYKNQRKYDLSWFG
jgi:hypothetical protein